MILGHSNEPLNVLIWFDWQIYTWEKNESNCTLGKHFWPTKFPKTNWLWSLRSPNPSLYLTNSDFKFKSNMDFKFKSKHTNHCVAILKSLKRRTYATHAKIGLQIQVKHGVHSSVQDHKFEDRLSRNHGKCKATANTATGTALDSCSMCQSTHYPLHAPAQIQKDRITSLHTHAQHTKWQSYRRVTDSICCGRPPADFYVLITPHHLIRSVLPSCSG